VLNVYRVSPTATGSDSLPSTPPPSRNVDAAQLSVDSVFTIHPSDPTKTIAYAPRDLRDPETDKPIFLQPHGFDTMFESSTLA
jgi:hypothetical protein